MVRLLLILGSFFYLSILYAKVNEYDKEYDINELWRTIEEDGLKKCYIKVGNGKTIDIVNALISSHHQIVNNKISVISALEEAIKSGCPINNYDLSGLTPLHLAVLFNDDAIFKLLIKHGANIHIKIARPGSSIDKMDVPTFMLYMHNKLYSNFSMQSDRP